MTTNLMIDLEKAKLNRERTIEVTVEKHSNANTK